MHKKLFLICLLCNITGSIYLGIRMYLLTQQSQTWIATLILAIIPFILQFLFGFGMFIFLQGEKLMKMDSSLPMMFRLFIVIMAIGMSFIIIISCILISIPPMFNLYVLMFEGTLSEFFSNNPIWFSQLMELPDESTVRSLPLGVCIPHLLCYLIQLVGGMSFIAKKKT